MGQRPGLCVECVDVWPYGGWSSQAIKVVIRVAPASWMWARAAQRNGTAAGVTWATVGFITTVDHGGHVDAYYWATGVTPCVAFSR
jgi:hypothetical protein